MKYSYYEAENIIEKYKYLISNPFFLKNEKIYDPEITITDFLISPDSFIEKVYLNWSYNGRNNKLAISKIEKSFEHFQVYLIHRNIWGDGLPYFCKLEDYLSYIF